MKPFPLAEAFWHIISNFSFWQNGFKSHLLQRRQKVYMWEWRIYSWAISSFATMVSKVVCCRGVRKCLYVEMEYLLNMTNFSFCHNGFKSCLLQERQKASICGKGLTKKDHVSTLYQGTMTREYYVAVGIHGFILYYKVCGNIDILRPLLQHNIPFIIYT